MLLLPAVAVGAYLSWPDTPAETDASATAIAEVHRPKRPTIDDMFKMTDVELARFDIAEVNLVCAAGLPGAENLDVDRYLATLDRWAEHARHEIDRHRYQFLLNPAEFENSEAYFNLLLMTTALQQDCGVKYNPEAIRNVDWADPRDQFIHGIIDGHGGTCVSLPVV